MTNTTALRNHLSNVIYIENNFGLDLFKTEINITKDDTDDFEDAIMMRQEPSLVANGITASEENSQTNDILISDFFGMAQRHNSDVNIMPYYYDASLFWTQTDLLKKKLSHFPLIIIDWQLEENENPKTGMDVFETIIKDNQILHYYVIYSNEINKAISSFSEKFTDIKIGEIKEDGIAVIDNAQASIDIAAYGFEGQDDIINALRRAKKRGVLIRGVVDDYGATLYKRTNPIVKEFGFIYDIDFPLLQKTMPTDESRSQSALMHNKFFVIDRKYVWTGSTNVTDYCMTLNSNNVVVISSEDLARAYSKEFEQMFLKNNFHISKIKTEHNSFVINNSELIRNNTKTIFLSKFFIIKIRDIIIMPMTPSRRIFISPYIFLFRNDMVKKYLPYFF